MIKPLEETEHYAVFDAAELERFLVESLNRAGFNFQHSGDHPQGDFSADYLTMDDMLVCGVRKIRVTKRP